MKYKFLPENVIHPISDPHIYKITNQINNKFYYGVHNGSNTKEYPGSGTLLMQAYDKYGIENFVKEVILRFDSIEEAYEYEEVIISDKLIKSRDCYNMKKGGHGGFAPDNVEKMLKWRESNPERVAEIEKARVKGSIAWGKKNPEKLKSNNSKAGKASADSFSKEYLSERGRSNMAALNNSYTESERKAIASSGGKAGAASQLKKGTHNMQKRAECPKCGYESNTVWVKRKCGINGEKCKNS